MTTMASHIATRLQADATVTSICADRVFGHDIRLDGPNAPDVEDANGFLEPHIIVDDVGGLRPPLGPTSAYQDRVSVYLVAESDATGRAAIETLATRCMALLHRWQEPTTKAVISYADRPGYIADPPPGTGAIFVLTFAVAGIYAGLTTS